MTEDEVKLTTKQWHSKRALCERYTVVPRTVERWVISGKFPPPVRMPNGRDYWADEVIEQHERDLVAASAARQHSSAAQTAPTVTPVATGPERVESVTGAAETTEATT
jgi:hypothetical protein